MRRRMWYYGIGLSRRDYLNGPIAEGRLLVLAVREELSWGMKMLMESTSDGMMIFGTFMNLWHIPWWSAAALMFIFIIYFGQFIILWLQYSHCCIQQQDQITSVYLRYCINVYEQCSNFVA